ncbi:MAG TPA: hypothetical protein VKC64_02335 [Burkholderiales bacterium]|nr:hypothetical protein [Burkholderiales bacterium]
MSERLWIGNVPPEASDKELVDLVQRYCRRASKVVERADGARPGRVLEFAELSFGEIDQIVKRIAGLFWKERTLTAYHLLNPAVGFKQQTELLQKVLK